MSVSLITASQVPINEVFGWFWITMGFVSGAVLGLGFHREGFLGGYGSWERRLLRLGHVAFFGTGLLNVMFAHSLSRVSLGEPWLSVAVWGFVVGAVAMPVCCVIAARTKKAGMLFALPVLGLTVGGVLTSIGLLMHALGGAAGGATGGAG